MVACVALTVLIFYSLSLLLPAKGSRGPKVLQQTLAVMEQLGSYDLIIVEKAPQYDLLFHGGVEKGNELSGTLPEYGLKVLLKESLLLLKPEGAAEWDQAEKMGLQGLAGFLTTPLDLLQERKDCFGGAIMGDEAHYGEEICQTVYFTVPDPEKLVQKYFPQVDCKVVDEVIIGAAVAGEENILKQLRILVEFGGGSNEKIERCYYIDQ